MRIDANRIPLEGFTLEEEILPAKLDLETELIKFNGPLKVKAEISRITNTVSVFLHLAASLSSECSRCLQNLEFGYKKDIKLNYPVDNAGPVIDLNPDIREEVMLDYPLKPLCKDTCRGLCPKCGENLNQGGCSCGST